MGEFEKLEERLEKVKYFGFQKYIIEKVFNDGDLKSTTIRILGGSKWDHGELLIENQTRDKNIIYIHFRELHVRGFGIKVESCLHLVIKKEIEAFKTIKKFSMVKGPDGLKDLIKSLNKKHE